MSRVSSQFEQHMKRYPASSLVVAYSGGVDSSVLLHVAHYWASTHNIPLRAVHVNHQLQAAAGSFEVFCQQQCQTLKIPLTVCKVTVKECGKGLEEAARVARFNAFKRELNEGETLLLGHHADDQAETVLFNLMRGSGLNGLAGIPAYREEAILRLSRPLLTVDRSCIEAYALDNDVNYINDPTNTDEQLSRNLVRRRIIPAMKDLRHGVASAIARSAEHCNSAWHFLNEVAQEDLAGHTKQVDRIFFLLCTKHLNGLAEKKRDNALRYFLYSANVRISSTEMYRELLRQLLNPADTLFFRFGDHELRCGNGWLVVLPYRYFSAYEPVDLSNKDYVGPDFLQLKINGSGRDEIGSNEIGVKEIDVKEKNRLMLGPPQKMSIKLVCEGSKRKLTLKELFTENQVVPWLRTVWPCICLGESLLVVAHLVKTEEYARHINSQIALLTFNGSIFGLHQALQKRDDIF